MTDLVTRLRALAGRYGNDFDMPFRGNTVTLLREVAAALEETTRKLNHESYCHDKAAQDRTKAERERDDLKARLLTAEERFEKLLDQAAGEIAELKAKLAREERTSQRLTRMLQAVVERNKKLEAVAEAARAYVADAVYDKHLRLAEALAALDAPPAHDGDGDAD